MLDLPDRSVLVLGLDHWEMRGKAAFQKIEEPRLQRLLYLRLKDDDRIVGDKPPELRTPPIDKRDPEIAFSSRSRDRVSAMVCLRSDCRRSAEPSDGWFGFRTWKRRSAQSMSALTAKSGRPRRSASFAAARTATCRTSSGGASCIKTSAARRRTRPTSGRRTVQEADVARRFRGQRGWGAAVRRLRDAEPRCHWKGE